MMFLSCSLLEQDSKLAYLQLSVFIIPISNHESSPVLSLCAHPLGRIGSQSLLFSEPSSRKLNCQVDYRFPLGL